MIQKLYMIAQELPAEKFEAAKKKIEAKYNEIERNLIEDFVRAQHIGNIPRMKEIASILTHFKGYSQCVDAFIETSQMVYIILAHLQIYFCCAIFMHSIIFHFRIHLLLRMPFLVYCLCVKIIML